MNASAEFFDASAPVAFAGTDAGQAPAFRWYDKDRLVHGRRLEDHLRFAVCYWHSFCWPGGDPFGGETFLRPWHQGGGRGTGRRLGPAALPWPGANARTRGHAIRRLTARPRTRP